MFSLLLSFDGWGWQLGPAESTKRFVRVLPLMHNHPTIQPAAYTNMCSFVIACYVLVCHTCVLISLCVDSFRYVQMRFRK